MTNLTTSFVCLPYGLMNCDYDVYDLMDALDPTSWQEVKTEPFGCAGGYCTWYDATFEGLDLDVTFRIEIDRYPDGEYVLEDVKLLPVVHMDSIIKLGYDLIHITPYSYVLQDLSDDTFHVYSLKSVTEYEEDAIYNKLYAVRVADEYAYEHNAMYMDRMFSSRDEDYDALRDSKLF